MRKLWVLLCALIAVAGLAAQPSSITKVVVFGDSLSDTGNLFTATGFPPSPYYMGRSSNGPLAVEKLAELYDVPIVNFAWYGATTGVGNGQDGGTQTTLGAFSLPGVLTAYQAAKAGGFLQIDNHTLYVVWAGPNDFVTDPPTVATVTAAVNNVLTVVHDLRDQGARRILVPGIPDLSLTPFVQAQGPLVAAQVSALSDAFNALLVASLPSGVTYFNTAGVIRNIVANPAAHGITNVTDACFNPATFTICPNPDEYLFWDVFHPTATAHELLGELFADCAQTRGGPNSRLCRVAPGTSAGANARARSGRISLPGSFAPRR